MTTPAPTHRASTSAGTPKASHLGTRMVLRPSPVLGMYKNVKYLFFIPRVPDLRVGRRQGLLSLQGLSRRFYRKQLQSSKGHASAESL
jgi:hypothetical protein